jgi:hypothetical protein
MALHIPGEVLTMKHCRITIPIALLALVACTDSPHPGPAGASHSVKIQIPLPVDGSKDTLPDTCWNTLLADLDPIAPGIQPECTAELHTKADELPMKRCAPGLTEICYAIVEVPQRCPEFGLDTALEHTDNYRVAGNTAIIECLVEESP